ncbi:ricin-type beta-trefoil lectin domain protein [Streptomyces sp. NPDC059378]|uniref:ricin-type beta-trefoil lectin domain protein n=1 Tax=Streptomyces sp. NPDC059378 TaxID=3346815 RepID=UPI003697BFCB
MNEAGPTNSPEPELRSGATDAQLSAELKQWTGASPALHPVGELLDRHWEAAFAYARLCTDGPRAAGMLTTAAFTRLFGESMRHEGPTAAWRPRLLVTVRRIAAEWDTDERRDLLHPALRSAAEDGDRAAARLLPPANRRLLSSAFQRLPQAARCLLWHVEVEAEPLSVPAALIGLDEEGARAALRRGRDRIREECLQLHQELAPRQECRQYLRLLDVTYRRGGSDVDPDLRRHLDGCRHCRDTADQLAVFNTGFGLALAEGVLGWGAADYVASRLTGPVEAAATAARERRPVPGAGAAGPGTATGVAGESFTSAEPEPGEAVRSRGARRSAQRARAARRRNLAAAVLTVSSLVVLPLVLWSALGSEHRAERTTGGSEATGTGTNSTATSHPSWVSSGTEQQGTLRGRLHNLASGLCVAVSGKPVEGAEAVLATCSAAPGEQWTYETDGLLRSAAIRGLCLDSRLGYSVRLEPCAAESEPGGRNVRYDFTLQGTLVPRSDQNLALSPAAADGSGALVLKNRTDTSVQRWVIDTSETGPQMQAVNWDADTSPTADAGTVPKKTVAPTPSAARPTASATRSATPTPAPTTSATDADLCTYYPYACAGDGPYGGGGYGGGYGNGGGGYGRNGGGRR